MASCSSSKCTVCRCMTKNVCMHDTDASRLIRCNEIVITCLCFWAALLFPPRPNITCCALLVRWDCGDAPQTCGWPFPSGAALSLAATPASLSANCMCAASEHATSTIRQQPNTHAKHSQELLDRIHPLNSWRDSTLEAQHKHSAPRSKLPIAAMSEQLLEQVRDAVEGQIVRRRVTATR